jgi:hypothetical protein
LQLSSEQSKLRKSLADFWVAIYNDTASKNGAFPDRSPGSMVSKDFLSLVLARGRRCMKGFLTVLMSVVSVFADIYVVLPLQLGSPHSLKSMLTAGNLSYTRFSWFQVSLDGNSFGLLSPNTRYWLALLPGSPFAVTATSNYEGILLGGVVDQTGAVVRNSAGDPTLYTTRELGTQRAAGDSAYGCSNTSALTWLRSQSNWASVPSAGKRFRSSVGVSPYNLVRVGMVVNAREVRV